MPLQLAIKRALGNAECAGDACAMALVVREQGLDVRAFHVLQRVCRARRRGWKYRWR